MLRRPGGAREGLLGGSSDDNQHRSLATTHDDGPTHPGALPEGVSRVDTMPAGMVEGLSRRPPRVGDVIAGRYRLIETLGDGAMGQVFVAENLVIGRRVAIKVLKPELLADATFRQRFQQEAKAIAAIEHRNVAALLRPRRRRSDLPRHGVRARPDAGAVLRGEQRLDPVARASTSRIRSAGRSRRRTPPASSTATSSRRTSSSRPTPRTAKSRS